MTTDEFWDIIQSIICRGRSAGTYYETTKKLRSIEARPSRSDKGKISFLRDNTRVKLMTRRFLTRILGLDKCGLSEVQLDKIAAEIDRVIGRPTEIFELLKGDEIEIAYKNEIGGNSCMTDSSAHKTRLYAMNPDRIRLITVQNNNQSARALLWKADDGKLYYDRIYGNSDRCIDALYDKMQEWKIPNIFRNEDIDRHVTGLDWKNGYCPYMDSFMYGRIVNHGKKLNLSTVQTRGYFPLRMTDGIYVRDNFQGWCDKCNMPMFTGQIRHDVGEGAYICDECVSSLPTCDNCGCPRFEHYLLHMSDGRNVCFECKTLLYTQCNHCEAWHLSGTLEIVGDMKICPECISSYSRCPKCNTHCGKFELTPNGLCLACDEGFTTCANCRNVVKLDDTKQMDDRAYCNLCYEKSKGEDDILTGCPCSRCQQGREREREREHRERTWYFTPTMRGTGFTAFPIVDNG